MKESAYHKAAKLPENIERFNAMRPKIDEAIRAGLTLIEFMELEGINREVWYKMKPKEFHWGHTQSRLNVKLKRGGKPKTEKKATKKKTPQQKKQAEYNRRYREKKKLEIEKENKRLERKQTKLEKLKTEVAKPKPAKAEVLPVKNDEKIMVLIGNSDEMSKMLKKMFG